MEIRPARDDDWPRIYPVFRTIVDAGETYAYPEGLESEQARAVWIEPAPGVTFVATFEDDLLGTVKCGPNRPGRGSHVATASFMVDPAHAGRGIGRALGQHVLTWAREQGYRAMQFNAVVETNAMAVRLWTSLGFDILCTVPEAFDSRSHGLVGLHVMHRRL